jgi:cysteine synthase
MRFESVIDAIGQTPVVSLRITAAPGVRSYAKLELQNLFGMKDRVARQIILTARESGELAKGAPLIESSSGTMALGVAVVGAALGHPVHIVTDPRIDAITLAKLRSLGCEVHIVERMSEHGWQSSRLKLLHELLDTLPGAFWPQQYSNPQNPLAYRTLAAELIADLDHVDILIGSVGSGGSLCGTARAIREKLPDLRVVGVDCVGSVLFGQPDWPQRLQSGLGNSMIPANLDYAQIDEVHWLNDREAFASARALAAEQQIFGGNTAGSVYRVMCHVARRSWGQAVIVGILPDRGDRYTQTVYDVGYWQDHQLSDMEDRPEPTEVPYPCPTSISSWSCGYLNANRPAEAGRR